MFSLIITIISIALVAALAVATVYYGGSAFSQGSAKASASTLVAQAQQIAGANTLFANDNGGTPAASVQALVDGGYLSAIPAVSNKIAAETATVGVFAQWTLGGANGTTVSIDLNDDVSEVAGKVTELAAGSTQFQVVDNAGDLSFSYEG